MNSTLQLFEDVVEVPTLFGVHDIGTVLMDPPWQESGGGKCKRGADRHYPLVATRDLPDVIRSCEHWERLRDDAHLYMWVTNTFLCNGDAQWLAQQIGFRPVTLLTWAKDRIGIGQYFRGQTEHVLFCVRGKPPLTNGTHSTLIGGEPIPHPRDSSGRIIHSRKPEHIHELIEQASPGHWLEIFARQERPGWLTWGNEIETTETINAREAATDRAARTAFAKPHLVAMRNERPQEQS